MATLIGSVLVGACSVVGIRGGTEEPPFTVIGRDGQPALEFRQYDARLAVETTIDAGEMAARSEGFKRLAAYIFGRNAGGNRIAMTAPVAQAVTLTMTAPVSQSGSTIRFFLPKTVIAENAPRPIDDNVRLVTIPAETVAVLRFAGSTSPQAVAQYQSQLVSALQGTAWQASGAPYVWFYDPPWTLPPFRRSEAVVPVMRR